MSMAVGPNQGIKNEINVTPLVDVVLVLLIIFMVVTPLLQRGKDVRLPKAGTAEQAKKPDVLVISVLGDRAVWLETAQVTRGGLRDRLIELIGRDSNRTILVKGDESPRVHDGREGVGGGRGAR